MSKIFEYATRHKIRFDSSKGALSLEQLWDVKLRSSDDFNLDDIAKRANKALKAATEESFVRPARTEAHTRLETTLEVVKRIIEVKLGEEAAAKERAENRDKKEKLLKALQEKQDGQLSQLSIEELQKQIAALPD